MSGLGVITMREYDPPSAELLESFKERRRWSEGGMILFGWKLFFAMSGYDDSIALVGGGMIRFCW